jgi:hypothetical protein
MEKGFGFCKKEGFWGFFFFEKKTDSWSDCRYFRPKVGNLKVFFLFPGIRELTTPLANRKIPPAPPEWTSDVEKNRFSPPKRRR